MLGIPTVTSLSGLGMYPSGAMDRTWMYTMLPPYPSMTAPGRWDESSVVGFTPRNYGPHVPWDYVVPYLYGAELGETFAEKNRYLLIGAAAIVGAVVGFHLGKR